MKNILIGLLLCFTFSAAAESLAPWPRITVWPDSVEVRVTNFDDREYRCSGSVWLYFESGRSRTEFVSLYVYRRGSGYRRIYNYNRQDKIRNAHHTISCF